MKWFETVNAYPLSVCLIAVNGFIRNIAGFCARGHVHWFKKQLKFHGRSSIIWNDMSTEWPDNRLFQTIERFDQFVSIKFRGKYYMQFVAHHYVHTLK